MADSLAGSLADRSVRRFSRDGLAAADSMLAAGGGYIGTTPQWKGICP
jgi:hypothetical protein